MSDKVREHVLWHQSGVSPTGEPFVQLIQDDQVIAQMSPGMAREHAQAITEAAEAAEQDAFLFEFGRTKISNGDVGTGMRLVMAFREFRSQQSDKSQGPRDPKDWVMPPQDKMPGYMRKDASKPKLEKSGD